MAGRRNHRWRRGSGSAAIAVAAALLAGGAVPAQALTAGGAGHHHGGRPPLPVIRPASPAGVLGFRHARRLRPLPAFRALHDTWPAPASAVISLAAPAPPPPSLPGPLRRVLAAEPQAVAPTRGAGTPLLAWPAGGPHRIAVTLLAQRAAAAAGVRGVIFTARAPAGSGGGPALLGISYAAFAQAAGGYYGPSLGLAELPGCALTTPARTACRRQVPLRSSENDWPARTVSAQVTLPAASASAAGPAVVLAAVPMLTDGGGAGGSYAATSLRPSGTWTAGGSSGSFTYSYPLTVPPAAGGLEPALSLAYDSGTIDGQTAAVQPQPSWIGDGWTLQGGSSFIEQSFIPCSDDPEGSASPKSTPDECYNGPVLTLSLGGSSVPIVCPLSTFGYTKSSACAASADNGEVITHHVASGNSQGCGQGSALCAKFADFWTVTTRDGTTYYFGLNHLKGWASGDAATNSVDTVPVYSAHAADASKGFYDPCYNSTWSSSVCQMAYRWNLDYVTDMHGNAMAYYYKQDVNAYAEDGNTSSAVSYIRDSHLDRIDYGFTDGNAYSGHAPGQVTFGTGDRCTASNCDPISTYYANWPDVPYHQDYCAAGKSCSVSSPTFWSTVALTSVTAQQWNGSSYVQADSWALQQKLPAQSDGTANLWLASVTRTGQDTTAGGSAVPLKPVSFSPVQLANRVNPGTYPYLYRNRIGQVTTEAGAVITVTYETPSTCTATNLPSPSSNAMSCFPVYWQDFTPPNPDWFNRYAVKSVQVQDPAGGSPGLLTSYSYSDPAGHYSWHYDDNELVMTKYRTYGQWRGYGDVTTYSGNGDPQTETETTYYQGMSDDNNSTAVTLTDSQDGQHDDTGQLAGDVLEQTAYTYPGGPVDHSEIYSYWVSPAAMTRTRSGLPDLTANFTGQVEDWARQALTDSGTNTWRKTETDTSYDTGTSDADLGLPLFTFRHGDLSDTSQQACTSITYAPANAPANLVGLPAETETDAQPCGGANPGGASATGPGQVNALTAPTSLNRPADVISDTRVFYDNPSLATTWPQPASPAWPQAAPGNADVSVTQRATGWNGSAFTYQTTAARTYDSYGRAVRSYDGNGGFNGTSYTPATTSYTMTSGSTTKTVVTNPLGQAVTTTLDPLRGLPTLVTDPNGIATTLRYDGLGRLTDVWEYGRATSGTPNWSYSYIVSNTGPSSVTAKKVVDTGGQNTIVTLYDSLLRVRQVQAQAPLPSSGSLVTDHFYDSRGWEYKTNINWWNSASPGTSCPQGITPPCIWTVADSNVNDQVVTQYDGLGRPVNLTSYYQSAVKSVGYAAYYGDRVTTIPPAGGTPSSTAADALGRSTELDQYTSAPAVTTGTNAGGFPTVTITGGTTQAATYSYDHRGWLAGITDADSGEQWTRSYNLLGEVTSMTDPNAGTSSMSYDADGNLTQSTNGDGKAISYAYDPVGRRTGEYDGPSTTSPPIATWVYDNSNNAVAGMTDPVGHLTTASSYDAAGNAYVIQQTGFNNFGESKGQKVTIPSTAATTAGGGSLAGTYTLGHVYTTETGLPSSDYYPASPLGAGQTTAALPAERVDYGYCAGMDLPCTLGGSLAGYVQAVTYTPFSQPAQAKVGSTTSYAWVTDTFNPHTGALTDTNVKNNNVSTPYDDTSYSYDPAGNITSQQDNRNGTQSELQCYSYDLLDRLTAAWTTDGTHQCSAGPTTGSGGTVGDGIPGGAYWTGWAYNPLGDQTQQTQHSLTGGTDTVTTYSYNGNGQNQPDTLTSAVTTGPGTGTATYTYDAAGNTTTRDLPSGNQALTWNDDGKLATDTTSAGKTTDLYDAGGNLLLAEDPGQTTLYLFGGTQQLYLSTATGVITGTRFIALPGGAGQVVRTGSGSSYWFELADQHGTSLLTLDSTTANPTWRQFTPYGASRGTPPGSWPDTNGYLGDPTGAGSGLTVIGARQYDPALGRFISIDPILNAASPQTLSGYAYAAGNPATHSDPSGLCITNGDTCQKDPNTGSTGNGDPYGGGGVTDTCTPATPGCAGYTPPGTALLPQGSRAAYDTFVTGWQDFLDPQATSSSPRYILDSLYTFCGGITDAASACGGALFGQLWTYHRDEVIAATGGIWFADLMMAHGLGDAAPGGTDPREARMNTYAATDYNAIAAEDAGAAAPRFIANSAGDLLDTSRITIPEGKFSYLLENPSKAGVFSDSMGFDKATLGSALRDQLVENFGNASPEVPMFNGEGAQIGLKFTVTSPLTGPSGAMWDITSAWGIDWNGTIRLITATP